MSSLIQKASKTYGKKVFADHLDHYTPQDPLYEYYTDENGRQKKKRRELPPGLSKRDRTILKSVKKRAHYLDKGFQICGFRFGWTFFIGLIPIVGDVTDAVLNYRLVIVKAKQADIPPWLLRRMLFNNAVSAGVGFIPLVGDVILAVYKANSRNAHLLEEFLRIRGEEFLKMGGVVEEDTKKEGWLSALMSKATRSGVSPKDAEQVKPGAGMTKEEMKTAASHDLVSMPGGVSVTAGASTSAAASGSGPTYGTFDRSQKRSTMTSDSTAVDLEASAVGDPSTKSKKRSHSGGGFFFGSSRKKTPPPGESVTAPGDKGRFVENVQ